MTGLQEYLLSHARAILGQSYREFADAFDGLATETGKLSSAVERFGGALRAFKAGGPVRIEGNPAGVDYGWAEARIMSHYFNTGAIPERFYSMPKPEYPETITAPNPVRVTFDAIWPGVDQRFAEERIAAQVAANVAEDIERARAATHGPRKITRDAYR